MAGPEHVLKLYSEVSLYHEIIASEHQLLELIPAQYCWSHGYYVRIIIIIHSRLSNDWPN